MENNIIFSLIFLCTFALSFLSAEFTSDECKTLGFIKTNLMCSRCNQLADFHLSVLKDHCLECCQKGDDNTIVNKKKYPKAILEVCTCKFGAYPQIQAFIKSDRPAKFPNLQIKYVRGLDPRIKMLDENDVVKEVLSITKWNTDTVQEFFETQLEKVEEPDYIKTNFV